MASTMAMPSVNAMPNFHVPVPGRVHGGYPAQMPVSLHGPMMPGPVVNGNNPPPAALTPPIQAIRLPMVPVGGGCYNDGMEVVWHGEFSRLFSSFFPPHVWYLSITNSAPQEKWKFYRDSAKVRFCCQDCGNGWTSMKGRVTFWFHLNTVTGEGFVQFKLYGQVCKKCNSGKFEYVMWYPEEVSKVMCNLYNKVGQTFYGFMQPPIRIDRRPGRPRNQHNADLCQACRDGECDQGRPAMKAIYNFMPPVASPRAPSGPIPSRPPILHGAPGPLVIRQPPIPPPRHIIMHTSNPSVVNAPRTAPSFITAPVTLTSRAQPILTYSVVTAPGKETPKLPPEGSTVRTEKEPTSVNDPKPALGKEHVPSAPTATTTKHSTKSSAVSVKAPPVADSATPKTPANVLDTKGQLALQKPSYVSPTKPVIAASLSRPKVTTPRKTTVHAFVAPRNATTQPPVVQRTSSRQPRTGKEPDLSQKEQETVNGYAAVPGQPLHKLPLQPVNGVAAV